MFLKRGFFCLSLLLVSCTKVSLAESGNTSAEDEDKGTVQLTSEVELIGEKYRPETDNSKHGYAYYGIRYATAERFKPAVENTDYSYLKNTSRPKQGYVCPQHNVKMPGFPTRNITIGEDCLYLDVYVPPANGKNSKALPVLFWIHGGGFQFGDKDLYNSTDLAAAVNAIVVTINYRVFLFGFLSTGDDAAKGNYGLGDAKVALKWVKKNIDKFGGDPNAITIFGESAGGAAVSAIFMDEEVRGSVRAAIAMSGSLLTHWAQRHNAKANAYELGHVMKCPNDTSVSMVECLKTKSVDELINGTAEMMAKFKTMTFAFAPVVDGEHIKASPETLLPPSSRKTPSGNFVTGYLKEDSALLILLTKPEIFSPNSTFDYAAAKDYVVKYLPAVTGCEEIDPALVDKVLTQYNISESDSRPELTLKIIHFCTHASFAYPSIKESSLYANQSSDSFHNQLYRITFNPGFNNLVLSMEWDLVYIFGGRLRMLMVGNSNKTLDDEVVKNLRDMIRQVAYNGRLDGPDYGHDGKYSEFGQSKKWETSTEDFTGLVKFWDQFQHLPCSQTKKQDMSKTSATVEAAKSSL